MNDLICDEVLLSAAAQLGETSPTARLDAELLLCHVLDKPRSWLYAWGDQPLTPARLEQFKTLLARRRTGEPIAYLTGQREFWGLTFETTPATLIPRPDTELLVEVALTRAPAHGQLLDMGTGTGAIGLAFAHERPEWQITGCDIAADAVQLARRNAERLAIDNARFLVSDWFAAVTERAYSLIVANPPYIAADDEHLQQGDLRFEPHRALVAAQRGLADLYQLIAEAMHYLQPDGWLLLEHGWTQAEAVRGELSAKGYRHVHSHRDLGGQSRISLGQCPSK